MYHSMTFNAASEDQKNVWIDLNGDGVKQDFEAITTFGEAITFYNDKFGIEIVSELDIHGKLTEFDCSYLNVIKLDVYQNKYLTSLICNGNNLEVLDVAMSDNLIHLNCSSCKLTEIDLSNNKKLEYFNGNNNFKVLELDLSNNTELKEVWFVNTDVEKVTLGNNSKLEELNLHMNYNLTSPLDLSRLTELKKFLILFAKIPSLDITSNTKLSYLDATGTPITSIDLSNNPELQTAWFSSTALTSLDLSKNTKLESLNLFGAKEMNFNALSLSKNPNIKYLNFGQCALENLDFLSTLANPGALEELLVRQNKLKSLDVSRFPNIKNIVCYVNAFDKDAFTNLITSLPTRSADAKGILDLVDVQDPYRSDVQDMAKNAKEKNWTPRMAQVMGDRETAGDNAIMGPHPM